MVLFQRWLVTGAHLYASPIIALRCVAMPDNAGNSQVFVIMQIGAEGSPERQRADEIAEYVIKPALADSGLNMYRSDLDPTPGQITPQIIKKLIEASVVVADLTGRNPNVYYELGIAHSFGRPVIVMCDAPNSLAFDTKDERVIPLGDWPPLAAPKAVEATRLLKDALSAVLTPGHRPSSVVSEVADSRNLDQLTPESPLTSVVAELAIIRKNTEDLLRRTRSASRQSINTNIGTPGFLVDALVHRTLTDERLDEVHAWTNEFLTSIKGSEIEKALYEAGKVARDHPEMKTYNLSRNQLAIYTDKPLSDDEKRTFDKLVADRGITLIFLDSESSSGPG